MWPQALIGSVLGSSAIQNKRSSMHESYRMLPNGTGGKQFATRMALNVCAKDCKSAEVVPATPRGDVRLGAPGVEPLIAAGQTGVTGGGGVVADGAGEGVVDGLGVVVGLGVVDGLGVAEGCGVVDGFGLTEGSGVAVVVGPGVAPPGSLAPGSATGELPSFSVSSSSSCSSAWCATYTLIGMVESRNSAHDSRVEMRGMLLLEPDATMDAFSASVPFMNGKVTAITIVNAVAAYMVCSMWSSPQTGSLSSPPATGLKVCPETRLSKCG
jgi:hypothetical protein